MEINNKIDGFKMIKHKIHIVLPFMVLLYLSDDKNIYNIITMTSSDISKP